MAAELRRSQFVSAYPAKFHIFRQISFSALLARFDQGPPIIIGGIVVLALALQAASFIRGQDANFCRRAFYYLVKGRYAAQAMIDWEEFKSVGLDVGETYGKLPGDNEKELFKKGFINKFAAGFLQAEGAYKAFVNWRTYKKEKDFITVAVDYKKTNDVLLFTLAKGRRKKIQSIQWKVKE